MTLAEETYEALRRRVAELEHALQNERAFAEAARRRADRLEASAATAWRLGLRPFGAPAEQTDRQTATPTFDTLTK